MNKFSFNSISDFDNHISDSIFGYTLLNSLIINLSSFFIKQNTTVIDLGCTSGKLLKSIKNTYNCNIIGYDIISENFIKEIKEYLFKQDITLNNFELPKSNLIFSVFLLQFLEYKDRVNIVKKVYKSLNYGGAFIVCEKEICNDGLIQESFTFSNYQYKKNNFSDKEILSKEKDLRSIMNPMTKKENNDILKEGGFNIIEVFFQSLNFKGYICRK